MNWVHKWILLLVGGILLHSCVVYMAYGLYRTVTDINETLTQVNHSITRIRMVLDEGKELRRASEDGRLVGTLAERIPSLIQNEVEQATREKIETLSGNLRLSAVAFTKNAAAEDLTCAENSYNEMAGTYNEFTGLMNDLSENIPQAVK